MHWLFPIHTHRTLWKDPHFLWSVFLGIVVLTIGLQCSEFARHHLQHTLQRQWEYDLLLDYLPVMDLGYFLAWGLELLFVFLAALAFLYPRYIPFSLKTIGVLYLIRSFFIILTPLGARPDQVTAPKDGFFYDLAYGTNEFFFSGHVAFPLMLALIFWRKPLVRIVLLFSTALFAFAVLVAHTHYSIDVFAVPFIVPTIFALCRRLFAGDVRLLESDFDEVRFRNLHGKPEFVTLSIIIPAHNEERVLAACLQSIDDIVGDRALEVIVVDNASTDRTAQIAAGFSGVRVVSEPQKGLTRARQRGLLEARGTHLAYIDADTQLLPGWTDIVLHSFTAYPHLIALSGPYWFNDLPRWQRGLIWVYWALVTMVAYGVTGYVMVGGNFIARKDALQRIGGFDTRIEFFGEDTNIARRLHEVGMIRFTRKLVVRSSSRRLRREGFVRTAGVYLLNYFSEVLLHRPLTRAYSDIR